VPTTITLSDEQVESIRDALAPPYDLDRVVDRLTAIREALDASHHDDYGTPAITTNGPNCLLLHDYRAGTLVHDSNCPCIKRDWVQ
jgi:hypothetical protein